MRVYMHHGDLRRRKPTQNRMTLIKNQSKARTSIPVSKSSARNHEATPKDIHEMTIATNHAIPRYFSKFVILPVSGMKPTLYLAPVLAEHWRFFVAFFKAIRATRREAASFWRVQETRRLTGNEHRV